MRCLNTLLVLAAALLFFAGCNSNEPISVITPATETPFIELFTHSDGKAWKIVSAKLNGTESLKSCEMDNTYTFYSSGNSSIDFGFEKCKSTEKEAEQRTWIVEENHMQWITPTDTFFMVIDEITENKLRLTEFTTFRGLPATLALTFKVK